MYHVKCMNIEILDEHIAYITNKFIMCLWHYRLGHISLHVIKVMSDQSLMTGLQIRLSQEFNHLCVKKFCHANRIAYKMTNPYCPQQNSIAEHMIVILMEMTCSMLHAANIDLQYWGKAFIYAVYICTITPTSALHEKILYTE